MARIPRLAARAVVLSPAGEVFLFRYDNSDIGVYWAPPGGGVDPGESREQALLRELAEETGWTDLEIGPELFFWRHDYRRWGVPVRQQDHNYLVYGPRRPPAESAAAGRLADGIEAARWWTVEELAATGEALWPPRLPELLRRLRVAGPPARPVDLGYVPNRPRPAADAAG